MGHAIRTNKAKGVLDSARSYQLAARLLSRPIHKTEAQFILPILPVITCLLFSLELYLKCLLRIEDKEIYGHKYSLLFNELSDDCRNRIEEKFKARRKTTLPAENEILDVLKSLDDAYVTWRYVYEQEGNIAMDIGQLNGLVSVIESVVNGLRPGWQEHA